MRANVTIDDDLMNQAMRLTGLKTKKEVLETSLRLLAQLKQQERIREARGKLHWEGDLDEMRLDN